jgi:hypothetical protein
MPKQTAAKKSSAKKHKTSSGGGGGGGAAMKILATLAKLKIQTKKDGVEKKKLGSLTGIDGASTIRNALAKLTREGKVDPTRETVSITDEGLQAVDTTALDQIKLATTNKEHHESVKSGLKKREVDLFEVISDGRVYEKTHVAKELGMTMNSTFRNLVAAVVRVDIVEHVGKGSIRLHENMFPHEPRPE